MGERPGNDGLQLLAGRGEELADGLAGRGLLVEERAEGAAGQLLRRRGALLVSALRRPVAVALLCRRRVAALRGTVALALRRPVSWLGGAVTLLGISHLSAPLLIGE